MEVGDPDAARRLFARMPADAGRVNAAINAGPLRGLRQDPTRLRVVMMTVGIGDVFADVRETIAAKTLFAIVAASPSPHEEALLQSVAASLSDAGRGDYLNEFARGLEEQLDGTVPTTGRKPLGHPGGTE